FYAFRRSHSDMRLSTDGGRTWPRTDTPGVVDSAAIGRNPSEIVISVRGRLYFFDPPTREWVGIEVPRSGIGGLESDLGLEVDFYGHTAGTIEKYDGPVSRTVGPDPDGGPVFDVPGLINPDGVVKPLPPALGPDDAKVRMKTGAKRTVDYRLKLSAKETMLDVFFLLDTSDTMSGTIQGLIDSVGSIINRLRAAGLDAHFGIGVSRAYTDTAVPRPTCESETDQNCERNFIYRRLVDLSDYSNDDQLRAALASLQAEAGGRFDSQLGALWAIATGEEIDDVPTGTMEPSDVPAGQDASFREGALNLIFVATDEPFATGEEGDRNNLTVSDFGRIVPPDIPGYQEVADAVLAADAKVLGLAIGQTLKTDNDSVEGDTPTAFRSMTEIANLTGAIAPEGGVDCDGDGVPELAAGDALVCPVRRHNVAEGENLAAAITKLVEAVRGTREIQLEVVRGEDVVSEVTPSSYPAVVKQKPNVLDFEVTYECPDRLLGKNVTVQLAAVDAGGNRLDSVTTAVACLEEKVDEPPLPIEPVITLGFVIPPLMPPAPPPIAANAPSAQGQAQSQSQAQAQGAMAHQEQQQPQLAYVGATLDHRQALEEELAMSDRRRSEVPQWATLGTGAVMASLAFGWLSLSRQRSIRVQRVRRR
ncbi:MAG TPA: vWA domain-containing protein, partial [Actinomycetota bacterium]|nr:vWA domain-containing protein [Actinomycetota bacterium]